MTVGAPERAAPPDLPPIELFLLGLTTGWELPRPLFDVWLHGRLSRQREIDDLLEEIRLRDAIDARRGPVDVRALTGPTFAELSRIRKEPHLAERAEAASRKRRGDAA